MNTLEYYNKNSNEYYDMTVTSDMKNIYDKFLNEIPKESSILDLGCGSGRDSLHFIKKGYSVTALDGSAELAKLASNLIKKEVIVCTFQAIELAEKFDGIWACASLLHLNKEDLKDVLNKLYKNLKDNGYFYLSFKYGDNEYIDEKNRYFNCFTEESIKAFIENNTNFKIVDTIDSEDSLGRVNDVKWLNIFCRKNMGVLQI